MHFPCSILLASLLVALPPFAFGALGAGHDAYPLRLAMMDMMPMSGGVPAPAAAPMPGMPAPASTPPPAAPMRGMPAPAATPPAAMAPGGMGDDSMRMGATRPGGMAAPAPATAPAPMAAAPAAAMPMCPMCTTMMQGMMGGGAAPMGAAAAPAPAAAPPTPATSAALLETRIAQMRAALRITDAQVPAWEVFAASLRTGRQHLDLARADLQSSTAGADPMLRLVSYENHLTARAEAMRITRLAFTSLQGQLNDEQKGIATSTMLPFIGAF